MAVDFKNQCVVVLILCYQVGLIVAKECPTNTLNVYYSSEAASVRHAPRGDFSSVDQIQINQLKKLPSLALDKTKTDLLFPGWDNPDTIFVYDLNTKIREKFERKGMHFAELATDFITGNVYFITHHNTIGVCNMERDKCAILVESKLDERVKRRNLLVHSQTARLFWIEEFHGTVVRISKMDGSDPKPYAMNDRYIFSMALDTHNKLLFVALPNTIEIIDLKDNSRTTFLQKKASHLYYFDCKLAVKSRDSNEFTVYNTEDKTPIITKEMYGLSFLLASESDEIMPPNPCETVNCNGVCVISHNVTSTECICEDCDRSTTVAPPPEKPFPWIYVFGGSLGALLVVLIIVACVSRCQYRKIFRELREIKLERATKTIPINDYTDHNMVSGVY